MAALSTHAKLRTAFLRLVGSEAEDQALTDRGEGTNEVVDYYLTRGVWAAQRYLLKCGYRGWRKRSSALSWSGSEDTDGGRYTALPSDFLRAFGSTRRSALVEADGDLWGEQLDAEDDFFEGDYYFFEGHDQLWITREADPPSPVYLTYHYRHAAFDGDFDDGTDWDFPEEIRPLIVAEAAHFAMEDSWIPGGQDMELRITRALRSAQSEARDFARPTKQPRQFRKVRRIGNRW